MQFFVDSADCAELGALQSSGLVDGVTTNPSLVAKTGRGLFEVVREICAIVPGPVSAEVVATDTDGMLAQGAQLAGLAKNVVVKVPLTWEGLRAVPALTAKRIPTNVTLCFTPAQALLAAKAGATYVSPFIGRLDDIGESGVALIAAIRKLYDHYGFATKILAASIRHAAHVEEAARLGADCATMPPKIMRVLAEHELTAKGLEAFLRDWKASGLTFK